MNVGLTLKANAKTTRIMQPCVSTLDHPTEFLPRPLPCSVRRLAMMWFDNARTKPLTMRLGVVATICVVDSGLAKRSVASAANGRDRVDERQQLGNVVTIRGSQDRADKDAIGVDEEVMLRTWSRTIGGVQASFLAAPAARTEDESAARTQERRNATASSVMSDDSPVPARRAPAASGRLPSFR